MPDTQTREKITLRMMISVVTEIMPMSHIMHLLVDFCFAAA